VRSSPSTQSCHHCGMKSGDVRDDVGDGVSDDVGGDMRESVVGDVSDDVGYAESDSVRNDVEW